MNGHTLLRVGALRSLGRGEIPLTHRSVRQLARVLHFPRTRAAVTPRPGDQVWTLLTAALEKFRALDVYSSEVFDALEAEWKAQGAALAGVWNESFVRDLYDSLEGALGDGLSAREWLPEASKLIKAYGGATNLGIYGPDLTGDSLSSWYADLVFRQNTMNALAAGRYADMFFGPALDESPFWLFASAEDDRVDEECATLDGQVFRKDDGSANMYLPPIHFECRCQCIELDSAAVDAGGYQAVSGHSVVITLDDAFANDRLDLVPDSMRRAA